MAITTNGGAGVTADAVATLSNKTLEAPVINNATFSGAQAGLEIKFGNNIVLEGTTANDFEMTLSGGDPTADRTITLPDATGTVALTSDITVTASSTTTFTNKTLTSPVLTTPSISNIDAAGDLIVGTADNTIGIVSIGTTGQVLTVAGGTATWSTPAAGTTANDQAFAFAVQVFA
jgi:hypothetical protein